MPLRRLIAFPALLLLLWQTLQLPLAARTAPPAGAGADADNPSQPASSVPPKDVPALYLPFDEGSGQLARDASESLPAVQGTFTGNPHWVDGRLGKAFQFDPAPSRLDLQRAIPLGSEWTIATWVKLPLAATGNHHAFCSNSGGSHPLMTLGDGVSLGCWDKQFRDSGFKLTSLPDGWHHFASVCAGGTLTLYIDGAPLDCRLPWQLTATDLKYVGACPNSASENVGAPMDEFRAYRRALQASDLAGLAAQDLSVQPAAALLMPGAFQPFTATEPVTWELPDANSGSISSEGIYAAPASIPAGGLDLRVRARSGDDSDRTCTVPVRVTTLDQGLLAYWPFEKRDAPMVVDAAGHGLNGLLANGPTWVEGRKGAGLHFNGKDSYVDIGSVNPFSGPFTVSAWVKFDAVDRGSGHDNALLGHGACGSNAGLHLSERSGRPYFGFYNNDLAGNARLSPGAWTHLVFSWDGKTKRIYVNGALDASRDSAGYQGTQQNARIGSYPWGGDDAFLGVIDEVRVFTRALSDSEVGALFTSTVNLAVAPASTCLAVGQAQAFSATLSGNPSTTVAWELPDPGSGSIDSQGVYTAPTSVSSIGSTFHIVARSTLDTGQAAVATVTVKPFVRVWPESTTVAANGHYPFQAEVTGLDGTQVTWSATAGTFSGNVYTAPSSTGTYTITATSVADATKKASATVKVVSGNIPANTGLVGYWKFDGNTQDSSGFANHGTALGGTSYVSGQSRYAMHFDGVASYVDIPAVNPFMRPFTVSVWVKFDAVNKGTHNAILGQGFGALNQGLHLGEFNGKAYFGFGYNDVAGTLMLQPGVWTHLTYVFDGTQKRIYVNGTLDASQSSVPCQSPLANAQIGRYPWSPTHVFLGSIDDLQVYNRALSDSEITSVYTSRINVRISPRDAVVALGQTQTFKANVTGNSDQAVKWSVTPRKGGTIDPDTGLYKPPSSIPYQGFPCTIKAVGKGGSSDTVQVTVKHPVWVAPKSLCLPANGTASFTAETTGLSSGEVTWKASAGAITTAGVFTAPAATGKVTLTATSTADGTKQDTATVTVTKPGILPDLRLGFDEGSGTTAADAMGSGVVGTLQNDPAWVDGRIGTALEFTSNAVVALKPVVDLSSDWTISAWFRYPFPDTGTWHTLTRGLGGDHQIMVNPDQVSLGGYDNVAGTGFHDSGFRLNTLAAGWHHVAAAGTSGTTQYYVDGAKAGNLVPWQSHTDVHTIGNYLYGGQPFGTVDELEIFRRALGPKEIASLASGIRVQLTPAQASVSPGGTQTFTATVTGASTRTVTWELPDADSGSISSKGVYQAPARIPYEGIRFRVLARSRQDKEQTARAWVTVGPDTPSGLPLLHLPFDEGSGDRTSDASGHGFIGCLENAPAWEAAGKTGKALRFDGKGIVKVPAFPALSKALTLSAWIYPTAQGTHNSDGGIILSREGEFELARFRNGTIRYAIANASPGWAWQDSGFSAPLDQWTHLAFTYSSDSGQMLLYANGEQVHCLSGKGQIGDAIPSQNELQIGGRQAFDAHFQGLIDEVRIYDRAIPASEVSELFQPSTVEVHPAEAGVWAGKQAAFQAAVPGLDDQRVTWELPVAGSGSVDAEGTYTAPSSLKGGDTTVPLRARSQADPARTGTATLRLRGYSAQDAALAGYWHFDEDGGVMVEDSSRFANHGTLTDGPVKRLPGQRGNALAFDGAHGRVTIPDHPALNPQSLTLSLWLRLDQDPAFDAGSNSWRSLLHKGDFWGGSTGYAVVLQKNRRLSFYTGTGGADNWDLQYLQLTVGQWSHVVLTYDASSGLKAAYQDGRLVETRRIPPNPLQPNAAPLCVNNPSSLRPTGGYGNFPGMIDEFRVYSRALAMSDVSAIYGQAASVRIQPPNAVLATGQIQPFQAEVGGSLDQTVDWSVLDRDGGTIDDTGHYTAPDAIPAQGTRYRIQARSRAVPSAASVVSVTIKRPVFVTPATITVPVKGCAASPQR